MAKKVKTLAELLQSSGNGEIARLSWWSGLGLAYVGNGKRAGITVSRPENQQAPTQQELERLERELKQVGRELNKPILSIRELNRDVLETKNGRFHVVRLIIYFGEQGRLF